MAVEPFNLTPITITVANTAVSVDTGASTDRPVTSVSIQADKDNTGDIVIGGLGVTTTNGIQLGPGDVVEFEGDNAKHGAEELLLSSIYINSATSGNSARVIAFRRTP